MFSECSNTFALTVKPDMRRLVFKYRLKDFLRPGSFIFFAVQAGLNFLENPWIPKSCSTNHYAVGESVTQYGRRFRKARYISVGNDRYLRYFFYNLYRLVFRLSLIPLISCPSVQNQQGDAFLLGNMCNLESIDVRGIPTGSEFQSYGDGNSGNQSVQ